MEEVLLVHSQLKKKGIYIDLFCLSPKSPKMTSFLPFPPLACSPVKFCESLPRDGETTSSYRPPPKE